RISLKFLIGGKVTELTQYPWTALLLTTFENGFQQTAFNCGGSLISSRVVLTAGHCVYDKEAVMKSVQVFLAEFDKRTFPRDCKLTGEGQKCIDNIAIYAEDVIRHPRPICLPFINIDDPEHARLQLTVAGWGRNGQYKSDTKQSTTVQLVPQHDCRRYYPDLTTRHLCAAGYSGEDTCKGDSGGPLMVLYRGKYYVVGVVSGKRTDTPCGSAVPSLYT
ncbi:Prophenoloxidase activating proteinase-2, partial [Operophtera brumata]